MLAFETVCGMVLESYDFRCEFSWCGNVAWVQQENKKTRKLLLVSIIGPRQEDELEVIERS